MALDMQHAKMNSFAQRVSVPIVKRVNEEVFIWSGTCAVLSHEGVDVGETPLAAEKRAISPCHSMRCL